MNLDMEELLDSEFDEAEMNETFIYLHNMEREEFNKICRLCLAEGDNKPIFRITFKENYVSQFLILFTNLQITENDNLPQNICYNCLNNMVQIYHFVKKCRQSDAIVRLVLNNEIKKEELELIKPNQEENISSEDIKSPKSEILHDELIIDKNQMLDGDITVAPIKLTENRHFKRKSMLFKCRHCDKIFNKYNLLRIHWKKAKHVPVQSHFCKVCKERVRANREQHMRSHIKEKPYKCKVCPQRFPRAENLKRHMITHTATSFHEHKKIYTKNVRIDDGEFKNPHLKSHSSKCSEDEKEMKNEFGKYLCMVCNQVYKTKQNLEAHQISHDEKQFLCNECGTVRDKSIV